MVEWEYIMMLWICFMLEEQYFYCCANMKCCYGV